MAYSATCRLYDVVKNADCCYDELCHYGQQDIYYFAASDRDECVTFYNLEREQPRNMSASFGFDASNTLHFRKSTDCHPSRQSLDAQRADGNDYLFQLQTGDDVECLIASSTRERKKITDEIVRKCSTMWFTHEFDQVDVWWNILVIAAGVLLLFAVFAYCRHELKGPEGLKEDDHFEC